MRTKIFVTTLLVAALSACMIESNDDSGALTYEGVDDFLKVAVNHIGANCKTGHKADPSHYLDGPNGELMLEQAKHLDKRGYGFSGDAFMGRTSNKSVTTMEDIEAQCRRLILSVDVEEGKFPFMTMKKGKTKNGVKELFTKDFSENGYGDIKCLTNPESKSEEFCNFGKIKVNGGKTRWFTYLEPDNNSQSIEGTVIITDRTMEHDGKYPITLKGIYREQLTPELRKYLQYNCIETSNIVDAPGAASDENVLHGRKYPVGSIYWYQYTGSFGVCKNHLYGLEEPEFVRYLEECNATCVRKNVNSEIRFNLRFTKHDIVMDCGDEIGFYVEDNKLHWTEDEGNGIARGWYDCRNGESRIRIDGASGGKSEPQSNDKIVPIGDDPT